MNRSLTPDPDELARCPDQPPVEQRATVLYHLPLPADRPENTDIATLGTE